MISTMLFSLVSASVVLPIPPNSNLVMSSYPAMDIIPAPVAAFRAKYDFSNVVDVPMNTPRGFVGIPTCNSLDPVINGPSARCSWNCNIAHCQRSSDISQCPSQGQWGLSVPKPNKFDDGPSNYTAGLLDYLSKKNIRATFFLVGSRVKEYPDTVLKIYREGHQIGYIIVISAHTWSHHALTTMTTDEVITEFEYTSQAIEQIIGTRPLMMRPPFGDFGLTLLIR